MMNLLRCLGGIGTAATQWFGGLLFMFWPLFMLLLSTRGWFQPAQSATIMSLNITDLVLLLVGYVTVWFIGISIRLLAHQHSAAFGFGQILVGIGLMVGGPVLVRPEAILVALLGTVIPALLILLQGAYLLIRYRRFIV